MKYGVINLLKAVAAQLIVLHHLAFYGPMADHVRLILPDLIDWLAGSARIAVQVFLVVGGFLAAKSLAPSAQPVMVDPLGAVWRRYAKLAPRRQLGVAAPDRTQRVDHHRLCAWRQRFGGQEAANHQEHLHSNARAACQPVDQVWQDEPHVVGHGAVEREVVQHN